MNTYFSSFTPEGMTQLAEMFQANEDERREFCENNSEQTAGFLDRIGKERREEARADARSRRQFMDELRAEGRRFRERCQAADQARAEQARELACQYRATADAFRRAQRARRA